MWGGGAGTSKLSPSNARAQLQIPLVYRASQPAAASTIGAGGLRSSLRERILAGQLESPVETGLLWSIRMRTSGWTTSIVPSWANQTVYIVENDFGRAGRALLETDGEHADLEATIGGLLDGQFSNPIRVIAFNTAERWSEDVSEDRQSDRAPRSSVAVPGDRRGSRRVSRKWSGGRSRRPVEVQAASTERRSRIIVGRGFQFHQVGIATAEFDQSGVRTATAGGKRRRSWGECGS
jgi:hypothetical protein